MKFDEIDAKMRVFETAHDHCVLPGIFMVARLDGRNFTRLTKEKHHFEAPYDPCVRDHMIETLKHLMSSGFRVLYGYNQSDEMSLLLDPVSEAFGRKLRKLNSVLAGEASAKFSLQLGDLACFDCRISQLPRVSDVVDYFRWRCEDAHRNALTAHCYWGLRGLGKSPKQASDSMAGMSFDAKKAMLEGMGKRFDELPLWQKRGAGVYWEEYDKGATNRITGETVTAKRKRLKVDLCLPCSEEYDQFVIGIVGGHA